mgnify:CR=1 FL=1
MMRGILRSRMPSNGTEHVPDLSHLIFPMHKKFSCLQKKLSYVIMCIRRFLYQSALLKMDGAEKK